MMNFDDIYAERIAIEEDLQTVASWYPPPETVIGNPELMRVIADHHADLLHRIAHTNDALKGLVFTDGKTL